MSIFRKMPIVASALNKYDVIQKRPNTRPPHGRRTLTCSCEVYPPNAPLKLTSVWPPARYTIVWSKHYCSEYLNGNMYREVVKYQTFWENPLSFTFIHFPWVSKQQTSKAASLPLFSRLLSGYLVAIEQSVNVTINSHVPKFAEEPSLQLTLIRAWHLKFTISKHHEIVSVTAFLPSSVQKAVWRLYSTLRFGPS